MENGLRQHEGVARSLVSGKGRGLRNYGGWSGVLGHNMGGAGAGAAGGRALSKVPASGRAHDVVKKNESQSETAQESEEPLVHVQEHNRGSHFCQYFPAG